MTAERILPPPAFKAITPIMHGYSSAAVAMGNLAGSCLSKSILDGSLPHHTLVLEGKAGSRNGRRLSVSARSLSARTRHTSLKSQQAANRDNCLCDSDVCLIDPGCKERPREHGLSQHSKDVFTWAHSRR